MQKLAVPRSLLGAHTGLSLLLGWLGPTFLGSCDPIPAVEAAHGAYNSWCQGYNVHMEAQKQGGVTGQNSPQKLDWVTASQLLYDILRATSELLARRNVAPWEGEISLFLVSLRSGKSLHLRQECHDTSDWCHPCPQGLAWLLWKGHFVPSLRSPFENLNVAVGFIGQLLSIQVSEDSGVRCGSFGDQIWNQEKEIQAGSVENLLPPHFQRS